MSHTTEEQQLEEYVARLGQRAKKAAQQLCILSTGQKNKWLLESARLISENHKPIIEANAKDLKKARQDGKDAAFIDRLTIGEKLLNSLVEQLDQVAKLPDPVGSISQLNTQPSGIKVGKMRMPIGVITMIYESRPNVTIEAAALAIKSGNAIILRGGSDAIHSNTILAKLLNEAAANAGLAEGAVQLVEQLDRKVVGLLLQAKDYIDVVIPRGGKGLVSLVDNLASVPVIKHLDGICHTYIDESADLEKAVAIAVNAKTHRYGVCNAMETLLVHTNIASSLFEKLLPIYQDKEVELRCCPASLDLAKKQGISAIAATEEDWATEYLAPVLSIKLVEQMQDAIEHIAAFGSNHTEVIVTENYTRAQHFLRAVDAASVMVNASSRFADGFEYGLGAEIGISTNKLHVRGPVGLEGLTTEKYVVYGQGEIR